MTTIVKEGRALACPSAQADMQDAHILGVVQYNTEGPRLAYLSGKQRLSASDSPVVEAGMMGQVLRFAAACENSRCAQFSGGKCGLGQRIQQSLENVVDSLPSCIIRQSCRWYAEQGKDICFKCPQVVTLVSQEDTRMAAVASPPKREAESAST